MREHLCHDKVIRTQSARVLVCILVSLGGGLAMPPGHGGGEAVAQAVSAEGQTFVLHTHDDAQATTELLTFLQHNNFEVTRHNQELLIVQYEGKHFLLDLKGKPGGVSFVVVAKPFTIEQEYRHTLEIRALVSQLNQRINFVKFYIGESGATLVMQSHITFLDQLEAQQVRRFLELFNDTLVTIAETAPEAMQYLK